MVMVVMLEREFIGAGDIVEYKESREPYTINTIDSFKSHTLKKSIQLK